MSVDHVELFGGIPFANPGFRPARLLAAASVVRAAEAQRHGIEIVGDALFDPDAITAVRRYTTTGDVPSAELTAEQRSLIAGAVNLIGASLPHARSLLSIPIRFRLLRSDRAISASSFAWPQHVFLGADAFRSPVELAEQITHEMCHCWLYLMEEVAPVHTLSERVLRLPSGTSGRDAAEVLGALHVAVTLERLWLEMPVDEEHRQQRLADLGNYAEGCITLLHGAAAPHLTQGGRSLVNDAVAIHRKLELSLSS